MSVPTTATGVLHTTSHQFMIAEPDGQAVGDPRPPVDGLVSNYGDYVTVHTGTRFGPVHVTVHVTVEQPAPPALAEWDDVVETSVRFDGGHARVQAFEDAGPEDWPDVTVAGPGWYRLRVSCRGRDLDYDVATEKPVEHFNITAWPAPLAEHVVHQLTDRCGAAYRASAAASSSA